MMGLQITDARLEPIAKKVLAGERLTLKTAWRYTSRTTCLRWAGWRTTYARRRHGNVCYFNVNRHINPTNVCVAHCKLCAFGRSPDSPGAYTFALDEIYARAARRRGAKARRSFTLSADCIPTCRLSITSI